MTPVGVLASGSGTNLQALLDAALEQGSPFRVAVVVSDQPGVRALQRADAAGVPAVVVRKRKDEDREGHAARVHDALRAHGVEWVICAGYLRVLPPPFVAAWRGRLLNIHPALLPAFRGLDGQGQALSAGARVAGATVHFVDEGTDTGPIVAQGAVPVLPGDDHERLRLRILRVEHRLLPQVVRQAAEGRLRLVGRQVELELNPGEAWWILDPTP